MPTFTLNTLRSMALDRLDGNSTLYTSPEIDYVINEAVRVTSLFTGFYRATALIAGGAVSNQLVYDTPAGLLLPSIVTLAGRQIQKISFKKLVRARRNWATDTTANCGQVAYWAPIGNGQFVITPAESVAGRVLAVTGMAEPPLMVNANDVLSIENEYVELIADYCAHRLPLKEGGKIFADGSIALNTFYSKVKERKSYEELKLPKYRILEIKQNQGSAT